MCVCAFAIYAKDSKSATSAHVRLAIRRSWSLRSAELHKVNELFSHVHFKGDKNGVAFIPLLPLAYASFTAIHPHNYEREVPFP